MQFIEDERSQLSGCYGDEPQIGAHRSSSHSLNPPFDPPAWYVAQTRSRHEKRIARQFESTGLPHFLPVYSVMSRWKDRKVILERPLFKGYIFVHIPLTDRLRVLHVPGIVRLVGFGGLPVALRDEEMQMMRNGFTERLKVEPHPYLTVGRRVRIRRGPLEGMSGVLVRRKGAFRVVISIALIQRSIAVDVEATDIEPSIS